MPTLMALQTCNRCRKRRLKCDLCLPSCGNCEQAGVECFFHDDSLQQDIPRNYLFALQNRVRELENEIKSLTEANEAAMDECESDVLTVSDSGYFLRSLNHLDDKSLARGYIGSGSSAQLIDRLLRGTVEWHITNKSQKSAYTMAPLLSLAAAIDSDNGPSLFLHLEERNCRSLSTVPLSTQRSLMEHYWKVIQSKYPLLSREQEILLLERENPLKWSMEHTTHPDSLALTAIFAISMALVARDLDSNFLSLASGARKSFELIAENIESCFNNSIEAAKQRITVLCFSAVLELVHPISGDIWEVIGRAVANMEQLRASLLAIPMMVDDDFRRLELSLLKIESSLALHFRRPSIICEMQRISEPNSAAFHQSAASPSAIYDHLLSINQGLATTPRPSQEHFENLIPRELKVLAGDLNISPSSATLYLALHPLFTASRSEIFTTTPLDDSSSDLLKIVANSASAIIDGFIQLNKTHMIISIWRSAERVLEAGAVWAMYVIKLQLMASPSTRAQLRESSAMSPLLKCNNLLISFSERWKPSLIYAQIWETFLLQLWGMME